jgi:hypothetical protein
LDDIINPNPSDWLFMSSAVRGFAVASLVESRVTKSLDRSKEGRYVIVMVILKT